MRLGNRWVPTVGLEAGLTGFASTGPMSSSTTAVVDGVVAARETTKLLMNPWGDSLVARWADEFSLFPSFTSKDMAHAALTIYNGTTTHDGCAAMYMRGDAKNNYSEVSSIASSTSNYAITWAGPTNSMNGSMPAGALSRPVAAGWRFTFSGVGTYHSIVMRVMELPPWGPILSGFANFPATCNQAPTFAQREYFRAREIVLKPGETVALMAYPADPGSLRYAPNNTVREDSKVTSWSGYVVWFFGMSAEDTIYYDSIMHHEYVVVSPITTPSTQPLPRAVVKPDVKAQEGALSSVVETVSRGWNVVKTVLDVGAKLFNYFVPMLLSSAKSAVSIVPPLSTTALPPHSLHLKMALEGSLDEKKRDDNAAPPISVEEPTSPFSAVESKVSSSLAMPTPRAATAMVRLR